MENKYFVCLSNNFDISISELEKEMIIKAIEKSAKLFEFRGYVIVLDKVVVIREVKND